MTTDAINQFPDHLFKMMNPYKAHVPSMTEAQRFVDNLVNFLFPIREDGNISLVQMQARWETLQEHFKTLVRPLEGDAGDSAEGLCERFFSAIPAVHADLMSDAAAFASFDPAARGPMEVILAYPGFYAITVYRLAHVLFEMRLPMLPRIISEYAHTKTGIDIHPGARIGRRFYIDHGTGVVIGETTTIGDNVKIYQGVTLGALYVRENMKNVKRHPTLEDNVIVYSGSTILGGDTRIGHDTVIGGNVWLTESVPPCSMVLYHNGEIKVRGPKK